ncbi:hypothetical protein ACFSQ7_51180 [Paenibacillus rhizoplanae]
MSKNICAIIPKIHKDMTLIVRQLAPGDSGLPLEIYAFSNETTWGVYESVQSDIFDHIFLRLSLCLDFAFFQNPTGQDIVNLKEKKSIRRDIEDMTYGKITNRPFGGLFI